MGRDLIERLERSIALSEQVSDSRRGACPFITETLKEAHAVISGVREPKKDVGSRRN